MKQLVEFSQADGSNILVEVEEPVGSGTQRVALAPGQLAVEAKQSFEEAIDKIRPLASSIITKLRSINDPADEVEVKFGVKLTAAAGAILTSIGGEANYEITLRWKRGVGSGE